MNAFRLFLKLASETAALAPGAILGIDPGVAPRGRTYREIAQILAEKCQVTVAPSTVHDFVRSGLDTGKGRSQPSCSHQRACSGVDTTPVAGDMAPSAESDVQGRIEALKQRRPPEKPEKAKFEYNENQPLQLVPGTKQQE